MIYVIGPRDKIEDLPEDTVVINTTSRSKNWSKGLSPFYLGPVKLYDNYESKNMENAWQYSKVYKEFVDVYNEPTEEYFKWAKTGWNDKWAHRYPLGKGIKPLYSYWNGQKLTYIEARKKIYIPLYQNVVFNSKAYSTLVNIINENKNVALWDFDGYNHTKIGMSLDDVVESESKKMGHAFVLYMMINER